jgi:ArsR family transcriptional regulator, arsenate/arsenite/antimonite-responsive transcriptional repressor
VHVGRTLGDAYAPVQQMKKRSLTSRIHITIFLDMRIQFADSIPLEWNRFAAVFFAMGDGYRQRIMLLFEPGEQLTIKQVAECLPLSRTAALHHIRVLQEAGLIATQKRGREVYLSACKATLIDALEVTARYAEEML